MAQALQTQEFFILEVEKSFNLVNFNMFTNSNSLFFLIQLCTQYYLKEDLYRVGVFSVPNEDTAQELKLSRIQKDNNDLTSSVLSKK